jgi:hypothetical protein
MMNGSYRLREGVKSNYLPTHAAPALLRTRYFIGGSIQDASKMVDVLEKNFENVRVGLHESVQVVLGYDWDGAVADSEGRRISQVFTSTVAGGGYGGERKLGAAFRPPCRLLLRAAYLATLLAAISLGKRRVLLSLIGGGAFHNPLSLIWESIQWAVSEIDSLLSHPLDVVVNGYNLGHHMDLGAEVLPAVRERGGAIIVLESAKAPRVLR